MRVIHLVYIIGLVFLMSCSAIMNITGSYRNNGTEIKFIKGTKKFEYFLRSEMGTLQYSCGIWKLEKNKLSLFGFNDDNLKTLDVESVFKKDINTDSTQVEVHYNTDNAVTYIKSVVVINDNKAYTVSKDTVLIFDYEVKAIQVKSYLVYSGLLSSNPKIDTLYSPKIKPSSEVKNIGLISTVHSYDFNRVKLYDTLTIKNSNTLYYNKIKLKKIR
ncbi:MAG TPA: hypothetical protein VFN30_00025 [Chitinophagaceae bacterium]|nr:hypothetical protein [Chitinophagaceae bacterium]